MLISTTPAYSARLISAVEAADDAGAVVTIGYSFPPDVMEPQLLYACVPVIPSVSEIGEGLPVRHARPAVGGSATIRTDVQWAIGAMGGLSEIRWWR